MCLYVLKNHHKCRRKHNNGCDFCHIHSKTHSETTTEAHSDTYLETASEKLLISPKSAYLETKNKLESRISNMKKELTNLYQALQKKNKRINHLEKENEILHDNIDDLEFKLMVKEHEKDKVKFIDDSIKKDAIKYQKILTFEQIKIALNANIDTKNYKALIHYLNNPDNDKILNHIMKKKPKHESFQSYFIRVRSERNRLVHN